MHDIILVALSKSIYSMYILYWSSHGLQFYNSLSASKTIFLNATRSVVRKTEYGKKLYYELALRQ